MNKIELTTIEKALAINLDPLKYGTIAEIGAGQEVARWFFQAGATAGTVAKTISAYDMKFSDEIYGPDPEGRYVSRSRLQQMLEQEFNLIISSVGDHRSGDSKFFVFADTVAARGYHSQGECHGWMGVRVQASPHAKPDDIILHVRLLDDTNLEQQDALGVLGVNLIYSAYYLADTLAKEPGLFLRSLKDNLKWGRIEIDFAEFHGPTLDSINNQHVAPELVNSSLTRSVLYNDRGKVSPPSDVIYKRSVLAVRCGMRAETGMDTQLFEAAKARFLSQRHVTEDTSIFLAEISMHHDEEAEDFETAEVLSRMKLLSSLGFHVLVSEYLRYFRIREYLARYTREPVALITNSDGLVDVMREENYKGLAGGFLEGLGRLFLQDTVLYVDHGDDRARERGFDDVAIPHHLRPLLSYLHENGRIVFL